MSDFTSSTVLYHPSGARCNLVLPSDPKEAFTAVDTYIAAGFLASAPSTVDDKTLDVRFVARGQRSDDKGVVDRVYFYREGGIMDGSDMTVYFDNADDLAKFEKASGLVVADMPLWKGRAAPQKTSDDFGRYAKRVNFTVSRDKKASKKYPEGRWVVVDYKWNGKPTQTAQNGAETKNSVTSPNDKVTTLPTQSSASSVQKTPEQLEAEMASLAEGMPVDFTKNPPPNEKSNRTGWMEGWLPRQRTIYKKVRSS